MKIGSFLSIRTTTVFCLAVLSLFVLISYVYAALHAPINCDTGCYLGIVELLYNGLIPNIDFTTNYTPLALYLLLIPRCVSSSYTLTMCFHSLILFTDSFFLALCVYRTTKNYCFSWLIGLIFLILAYYLEGIYLYLEPYSLLFGECAMLEVMATMDVGDGKRLIRFLLSGVFVSLAFLSKQYGIVFAVFVGIMILLSDETWKQKVMDCFIVVLGFCIPLMVGVLLFVFCGGNLEVLISAFLGNGYGERTLGMYANGMIRVLRLFPWLILIPLIMMYKTERRNAVFIACLACAFFASFQFCFYVWTHYYLFLLPFVLLLSSMILHDLKARRWAFLAFYGLFFTASVIPLQEVYKITSYFIKVNPREVQEMNAELLKKMKQQYGVKRVLCFDETVQYYYLSSLLPAGMEKYGFSFGRETDEIMIERLKDADGFIVRNSDLEKTLDWDKFNKALSEEFILVDDYAWCDLYVFIRRGLHKIDSCY